MRSVTVWISFLSGILMVASLYTSPTSRVTATDIIRFRHSQPIHVDNDVWQKAAAVLNGARTPQRYAFGTEVQDNSTIQVTIEWADAGCANIGLESDVISLLGSLSSLFGTIIDWLPVQFNQSAFEMKGPATAKVVEYVRNVFAVSRLTPKFKQKIEQDFIQFDQIYQKGKPLGQQGWAMGWTLEEVKYPDVEGEMTKSFIIVRGWNSFEDFERSLENEYYTEAVSILYEWKAPFQMWHVERKVEDDVAS